MVRAASNRTNIMCVCADTHLISKHRVIGMTSKHTLIVWTSMPTTSMPSTLHLISKRSSMMDFAGRCESDPPSTTLTTTHNMLVALDCSDLHQLLDKLHADHGVDRGVIWSKIKAIVAQSVVAAYDQLVRGAELAHTANTYGNARLHNALQSIVPLTSLVRAIDRDASCCLGTMFFWTAISSHGYWKSTTCHR
jgi:hypothetical protein